MVFEFLLVNDTTFRFIANIYRFQPRSDYIYIYSQSSQQRAGNFLNSCVLKNSKKRAGCEGRVVVYGCAFIARAGQFYPDCAIGMAFNSMVLYNCLHPLPSRLILMHDDPSVTGL